MATSTVIGKGNGGRSGAQTLLLLVTPLNVPILRALAGGPKRQAELQRETGSPAPTTLRSQLKRLIGAGAVEKHRGSHFPGALEYELTQAGRGLTFVAETLERWLGHHPKGSLALEQSESKAAVKALTDGWSAQMLRVLAAGPRALTELDRIIPTLNYPALERRLSAMRLTGLASTREGNGRATPYGATSWLRQGMAPLLAAANWEAQHRPGASPRIGRVEIETSFLLAMPLLALPEAMSGSCRMAAELHGSGDSRLAGVLVGVSDGRLRSCVTDLRGNPDAWALGASGAWLAAVVERDVDRLELGGDSALAGGLVEGLHAALFAFHSSRNSSAS